MSYKKVSDEKVQIVFKKECDCKDSMFKSVFPCDIGLNGVPTCYDCGADYVYDCVKVEQE